MIKSEKLLSSLSLEIPALEENAEGQLKGGFEVFVSSGADVYGYNENCNCNCDGCDINENCNCNCGGCTTNKGICTTTKVSKGASSPYGMIETMLF